MASMTEEHAKERNAEESMEYIQSIAEVFNIDISKSLNTKKHPTEKESWTAQTDEHPLSEFEDLEQLLVGAFPQIFILGIAYKFNKKLESGKFTSLSKVHFKHLLLQYTTAAATNRELLFFLFDYFTLQNGRQSFRPPCM